MAERDDQPPVRVVDRRWWARGDAEESDAEVGVRKPTYVEDLERRLADQAAQLQSVLAERRRAADEFDSVRQRMRRDTARDVERARRAILAELLDVVDNLDRAIAAARAGSDSGEMLLAGIELVRDQFLAKLAAFGVTRFNSQGQPFDATRHEAVSMVPVEDAALDDMVVSVVTEGYTIGDELLRAARVVVGRRRKLATTEDAKDAEGQS
jgi:molecular chaperone GrpE